MKFLSIYKKLLEDINGGIYKQGDSLPTLKELIKRFGVSKTAIDNALRILVRDGVIKRVRSQGTFVRSMPGKSILDSTRQSRILFLGKGTLEGLIVDDFANRTVLGINNVLIKTNRSLHFIALRRISAAEALAIIDAIKPAGVILFAIYDKEIINGLKERKMPAVCLDTVDHSIPLQQFTSDHQSGGILALRKLHELNHKRVLFIGTRQDKGGRNDTDHEYWSHTIRAEAAILKMQNVRCEFVAAFKRSIMVRELETILKNIPERIGIICASGSILRMLKSLSETHPELIEGKDIDTVLFTHYASRDYFVGKPVWQVRWNMREMGQQAMTHLLSHIENGAFKTGIHKMPVELY